MRDRLAEMAHLVARNSLDSQQKQKQYYDRGAKSRNFDVGDQVLVLLPTTTNRLKLGWTGPYKVTRRVNPVDYELEMPGRRHEKKTYHVNLMKKWYVMTSHPQTALLAGDFESKNSTEEYDSTEEDEWSEVGDYMKFSEQFFP